MKKILLFGLLWPLGLWAGTLSTFTLPSKNPCEGSYYIDIQASFPQVDFNTLDRLYIPAGHYSFYRIGNLPNRPANNPLVITNSGGQVRVGGCGHHYNFSLTGGKNWVLTGHYDAVEATGDVNYPGHAQGQYAHSAGTYGILIDADFGSGHIGLGVGGGASNYTVSFIEARHLNFAGMMFKTDDDGQAHMDNVYIHDNYIHDTLSEGVYLGSTQSQPQHKFNHLRFFNNRIIRAGTELAQFGNLGDDVRIHNNVFFLGALEWKKPFQNYQDSGIQLGHREGSGSFDHNIVIGAASNAVILFNPDVAGDVNHASDQFSINNNYFAYSRNIGMYIHSSSDGVKQVDVSNNLFSQIVFSYDELNPGAINHQRIIRSFNQNNPITLTNNTYDSQPGQSFYSGYPNIVASNNQQSAINEISFYQSGWPGVGNYFTMEIWTHEDINSQPVVYETGDLVVYQGIIYQAMRAFDYAVDQPTTPDQASAQDWQVKPAMADDVRQLHDSEFAHIGLLDVVLSDVIFAHSFEQP